MEQAIPPGGNTVPLNKALVMCKLTCVQAMSIMTGVQ